MKPLKIIPISDLNKNELQNYNNDKMDVWINKYLRPIDNISLIKSLLLDFCYMIINESIPI